MTIRLALAALLFAPLTPASACTFCNPSYRTAETFRTSFAGSKVVAAGKLKNPRFDPKTDDGTTDFEYGTVLKDDPARGTAKEITLTRYMPVVGNTPPEYLVFFGVANGKLDAHRGVPATPAVIEYVKAAALLDDKDPSKKLGFYFKHLDSADAAIAEDAFVEFARASDADIAKAAKQFDAARLRHLVSDPKTPQERLGLFAFVLGTAGGPADAAFLAGLLKQSPRAERYTNAVGGLLAGYILLAPKDGWAFAAGVVGDAKREFPERFAVISAVRGLQASRPEFKADVLVCCAAILPHGDLADLSIEDLRRWG